MSHQYEDLKVTTSGGVARLNVNRPNRLNALRNQTGDEMQHALAALEDDPAIRVVVMSGEGRAYGAGYDLTTIEPDKTPALDDVLEKHFNPVIRQMRKSRLPIVARVNGPCAGASVGLALAADIVIAAESAFFYEPFVGIALVPDAGNTLFLPRIIGRIRAAPLMLLGDRLSAKEARDWGLVWKVVQDDQLDAEVDEVASRLVKLEPKAVCATKRLITAASEPDLDSLLDLERDLQGEAGRSPEMKAAVAAFFAKKT